MSRSVARHSKDGFGRGIVRRISVKPLIIWLVGVGLLTVGSQGHALDPASAQSDTLKEIIEVIEDRHYASRRYDDGLSAQHFTAYLDALDPQRMFFDADDIDLFSQWRLALDNAGRAGDLAPAFTMFNKYHDELKDRLTGILGTLPETIESFDYEVEEYLDIDSIQSISMNVN